MSAPTGYDALKVKRALQAVSSALNSLGDVFGPEWQLTLVARIPSNKEAEMVVTNDDLSEVVATVERSKTREVGGES